MPDTPSRPTPEDDGYKEFARKMLLFEEGPTTTNFQQLVDSGVAMPPPDAIADADLTTKLWEVLHGLSQLRVYLDETDHLSDRELYTTLWNDVLRTEVPAIDEIGFNARVQLLSTGGEPETTLYLKYFADRQWRDDWLKEFPDIEMPDHEDPPYDRDRLMPRPADEQGPEALAWLRANHHVSALATNRFSTTADAVAFVEQLYSAGAAEVRIDNIMMLPNDNWAPYADTLIVDLPKDGSKRRALLELIEHVGTPDEDGGGDHPVFDAGQTSIRLWWD